MEVTKLKDIGKIITGNTPSTKIKEYYNSNDIPFIKPTSFNKKLIVSINSSDEYISNIGSKKGRLVNKGTVLVTCIGEIGNVGIVQNPVCFNQQINAIEPNMEICLPEYLAYSLFNIKQYIKDLANAPVVPIINKSQFSEIEIPLPPLPTQRKIVEVLDKAQSLIDKRKEQIELLDKLIQSTFYDMFGDPINNQKKFPLLTVDDVIKFTGGSQPDKKYFEYKKTKDNIRLIQIRDYKTNDYLTYIPVSKARKFCIADDIMIGRYGPPIFQILKGIAGAYNVALMKATPKKGNKEFIRQFLKQNCLFKYLESLSQRTAGQTGIDIPKLKGYPFPYPPIELQNQFAQKVEKIEQQKTLLNQSLKLMEDNFNSLMQRAFRGEII